MRDGGVKLKKICSSCLKFLTGVLVVPARETVAQIDMIDMGIKIAGEEKSL